MTVFEEKTEGTKETKRPGRFKKAVAGFLVGATLLGGGLGLSGCGPGTMQGKVAQEYTIAATQNSPSEYTIKLDDGISASITGNETKAKYYDSEIEQGNYVEIKKLQEDADKKITDFELVNNWYSPKGNVSRNNPNTQDVPVTLEGRVTSEKMNCGRDGYVISLKASRGTDYTAKTTGPTLWGNKEDKTLCTAYAKNIKEGTDVKISGYVSKSNPKEIVDFRLLEVNGAAFDNENMTYGKAIPTTVRGSLTEMAKDMESQPPIITYISNGKTMTPVIIPQPDIPVLHGKVQADDGKTYSLELYGPEKGNASLKELDTYMKCMKAGDKVTINGYVDSGKLKDFRVVDVNQSPVKKYGGTANISGGYGSTVEKIKIPEGTSLESVVNAYAREGYKPLIAKDSSFKGMYRIALPMKA